MSTENPRTSQVTAPVAQVDESFGAGLPAGGVKPYAGTTGRGGSDASREVRAEADESGLSGARQIAVMSALEQRGPMGITIRELGLHLAVKPGDSTPSSTLSVLHKANKVVRLATVRRNRQSVYVLPQFVEGRAVAKHGGRITKGTLNLSADEARLVEQFVAHIATKPSDSLFTMKSTSAKVIASILTRALGEVR